jgi:DNA-directed RNA polymerase specialized sigma24 family protein
MDDAGDAAAAREAEWQLTEAVGWLQGDEARLAAGADLARLGLRGPAVVDDVLAEVTLSVLRRIRRRGALVRASDGVAGVVAYCRRSIRNAAIDVVRGPRLRSLEALMADAGKPSDEQAGQDPAGVEDVELEAVEEVAATELADGLRRALYLSVDARRTWRWSAALVVLALARNPDLELREGTPEPDVTAASQRLAWAGLHYAGRDECFTDQGGAADPACRMRRTRAMRQVAELLQRAAGAVAGGVVPS